MSNLSKRSTVYFEPTIHQALKMRAASSDVSVSELIDEAVRLLMREDQEDLAAVSDRVKEPEVSYEVFLNELKADGKIEGNV
ncbi:CopG family transcriptional regulator [Marinomonas agarivorans]|nr:CopG family transcriptional regulator [Marinomonas agarivorans]